MKIYQAADQKVSMSMFSPDQLGKFIFNQGVYALCKDNYLQASEKFQEAYKINKHNVFLLIYMGIILTMRKNFYAAEKYFAEATKRDPNYDEAWFYSAENLFQAGNFNGAYECFEKTEIAQPGLQQHQPAPQGDQGGHPAQAPRQQAGLPAAPLRQVPARGLRKVARASGFAAAIPSSTSRRRVCP